MNWVMRDFILSFLVGVVAFAGAVYSVPAYAANQEHIRAVVNDEAVSGFDVAARLKLIMVSANMPDRQEIKDKLTPQVVDMLIDERLRVQEAKRLEIDVTETEIDQNLAAIAGQNKMTGDEFRQALRAQNVPVETLEDKLEAQIAWQKLVQARLAPRVDVPENQVIMRLARAESMKGKTEYLLSEIFLPVDDQKKEANVRQLADRLLQQMTTERARFDLLAGQFSQSATAARGGDMGWVPEGQLGDEIDEVLAQMNEGELSRPIRSQNGYHIMFLRKKQDVTEDSLPSEDEIRNQLGMEQLERLQRSYMMDLKTSAFIEYRA
jgi:peptidyl-prolyl cis-trans isomerase SurA